MLRLINISKKYFLNDGEDVLALKGISIDFRDQEFVSILGPSGCGKTTLLNIIGGLDRFTDGDLIIDSKSTKNFRDSDFDSYRNHKIGFVFQSYNLIMHQSVLSNVELALTLSGVSLKERRKRALEVLEKVGLKDQIHKKPNQLSGGQMQRVAIARALVNDPEIILADEPTGALDSKTSLQIMKLLKEISHDKLIIMVTHNENLANEYSTRIIKLLDGMIQSDSNPYVGVDSSKETFSIKKIAMNFKTALSLSFQNLLTKKGRTILTSFAGSIGIIGIALILSLSSGVQNYIDRVESDALSTYPLTVEATSYNFTELMTSFMGFQNQEIEHDKDKVYSNDFFVDMLSSMTKGIQTNNLQEFKKYVHSEEKLKDYTLDIQYHYPLNLNIYKNDTKILQVNPSQVFQNMGDNNQMFSANSREIFTEMLDHPDLLKSQYDLVAGHWPTSEEELVLVLDSNHEITDYVLYSLGIKDQDELNNFLEKIQKGEKITTTKTSYSYEELLNLEYKLVLPTSFYEKRGTVYQKIETDDALRQKIQEGITLRIAGIVSENPEVSNGSINGSIGYLPSLTNKIINSINESEIVKDQKNNKNVNVFTGLPFDTMYTYDMNIALLNAIDFENPSGISFYAKDFESKEKIIDIINSYNEKEKKAGRDENIIKYTDLVGTMIDSISSIVGTISYVLIAFVTISLIVSSIMIGIITYISVIERTKEIGILRAIGARKKDISRVFNAETIIIGFTSGVLGIAVTMLLNVPINVIIKSITNISGIAHLPLGSSILLILISMTLTLIAGLIPSRVASKKDPVLSLRVE